MITTTQDYLNAVNEIDEYDDKKKTKRLDALEQERYTELVYEIQQYLANNTD